MNMQDEGWIDPFDTPNMAPHSGGISEFARQEEEETMAEAMGKRLQEFANQGVSTAEVGPRGGAFRVQDVTKDTNPKDAMASAKPPLSYLPFPVLYEVGLGMLEGARKYGGHNWRSAGVRASVYFNATMRHLAAWWEGQDIDPDSGLSHITKAISSLLVLRDAQMQGTVEHDDRPIRASEGWMEHAAARARDIVERYPEPVGDYIEPKRKPGFTLEPGPEFYISVRLPVRDVNGEVYEMRESRIEREIRDQSHGEALATDLAQTMYVNRVVTLWRRQEDGYRVRQQYHFVAVLEPEDPAEGVIVDDSVAEPEVVDEAAWGPTDDGRVEIEGERF